MSQVAAYSTYFWFSDVEKLRPLNDGCQAYGFLFSKTPLLTGWFRTVHKVVSAGALVVFAVLFGYTVWQYGSEFVERSFVGTYKRKRQQKKSPLEQVLDDVTNPDTEMPVIHKFTPALCVFILCVAIAAIECLIKWNGIVDVNEAFSTGQLIPLVTGVGGLVRVLYLMWSQPNVRLHVIHREKNLAQPVKQPVARRAGGEGSQKLLGP